MVGTTTDAGYKLDVNGTLRATSDVTGFTFNATTNGGSYKVTGINVLDHGSGLRIGYSASVTKIGMYTNSGTERITIINNGNVGFGQLTPVANIHTSGSVTAASALAQGVYFNNTLVAAANNDVLVGLDITPTYTNGAFTGVSNLGLRVTGGADFVRFGSSTNYWSFSSVYSPADNKLEMVSQGGVNYRTKLVNNTYDTRLLVGNYQTFLSFGTYGSQQQES